MFYVAPNIVASWDVQQLQALKKGFIIERTDWIMTWRLNSWISWMCVFINKISKLWLKLMSSSIQWFAHVKFIQLKFFNFSEYLAWKIWKVLLTSVFEHEPQVSFNNLVQFLLFWMKRFNELFALNTILSSYLFKSFWYYRLLNQSMKFMWSSIVSRGNISYCLFSNYIWINLESKWLLTAGE